MRIFIPTYGRATRQVTYDNLPRELQEKTTLVVQRREKDLYKDFPRRLILPPGVQMISPTRQYIMNYAKRQGIEKLVMLDDDLKFDTRREDDPGKFLSSTHAEVRRLFATIEKRLGKYAHVGVLAREGGNRIQKEETEVMRMMRVLAYHVPTFHKEKVNFDRLPCQQDFDVTLQLLKKGYPNLVLCGWVQGQGSSNAEGGCSSYRTLEMLNENAHRLAKLHAPFVKVVEKETKTAWGGGKRNDVHVQWKKAYEYGLSQK